MGTSGCTSNTDAFEEEVGQESRLSAIGGLLCLLVVSWDQEIEVILDDDFMSFSNFDNEKNKLCK